MEILNIKTRSQFDFVDITGKIKKILSKNNIKNGVATIFVPHTTGAVTINEGADPAVVRDIIKELGKIIPLHDNYLHAEGNSAAHIKSSLIGCSEEIIIENGSPVLGTWQSIFFCEFDGPRNRKAYLKIIEG